ncbi:MAG: hypothetical protein FWG10_03865 [Eubacteriaceae bacterium]|nr:hypothetical protein [Eubacteriaceae bacterium]
MKKNIIIALCTMLLIVGCGKTDKKAPDGKLADFKDLQAIGEEILLSDSQYPLMLLVMGPSKDDHNGELVELSRMEAETFLSTLRLNEWEQRGEHIETFDGYSPPFYPGSLILPGDFYENLDDKPSAFELLISYKNHQAVVRRITYTNSSDPNLAVKYEWQLYHLPDGIVDGLRDFEAGLVETHNLTFPNRDRWIG